ncbi:MAG: hypothetical protein ABIS03_06975 [Gemmatimonadaceae bacterium]
MVATFGLLLALLAITLAGVGSRWEWWHFRTGFATLKWGAYAALAAVVLTMVAALLRRDAGRRRAIITATVLSAIALGVGTNAARFRRFLARMI